MAPKHCVSDKLGDKHLVSAVVSQINRLDVWEYNVSTSVCFTKLSFSQPGCGLSKHVDESVLSKVKGQSE